MDESIQKQIEQALQDPKPVFWAMRYHDPALRFIARTKHGTYLCSLCVERRQRNPEECFMRNPDGSVRHYRGEEGPPVPYTVEDLV